MKRRKLKMVLAHSVPPEERFMSYVDVDKCWLWKGGLISGYGTFKWNGERLRSHRLSYELFSGPIPEGLVIDHLCRKRNCVNPDHLEPVTLEENILRGNGLPARNKRKTHCLRGHPFSPDNVRIAPNGSRICRICISTYLKRWTIKNRKR